MAVAAPASLSGDVQHGPGRCQRDLSALVIRGLETSRLVRDVVRVSAERQGCKAVPGAG